MKYFLFVLATFLIAPMALATSGACSWHGGVDCSAGPDWDGSVICYDGWRDSSVSYYSMVKCQGYNDPIYTTPSCPLHSTYSYLSDSCKCNSGYTANSSGTGCISMNTRCVDLFGWHASYNSFYDKCECSYGYVFGKDILGDIKCIDGDDWREDMYGWHASYDNLSEECECDSGYYFNGDECVRDSDNSYSGVDYEALLDYLESQQTSTCPNNSTEHSDGKCYCNYGYKVNESGDGCTKVLCSSNASLIGNLCVCDSGYIKNGEVCVTPNEICQKDFGPNSYGTIEDGSTKCHCATGFIWDDVNSKCIEEVVVKGLDNSEELQIKISEFINKEKELVEKPDQELTNRLTGKILLQVNDHGEAWYVCPKDKKRYYMANGSEAYKIMRDLGVGITNTDLDKVRSDNNFAKRHSGKIFLQVEDLGQAYYVDFDGEAHYLKDGEAAYTIMRDLGLGITNENLRKLSISA